MRTIAGCLGVVIALWAGRDELAARAATWQQIREGATWTLEAVVTEITGPNRQPGELVRFTVRRDGRFIHSSASFDGGRFAGPKWFFGGPSGLSVEDLLPEAGVGWILHLPASTGSALSFHACIVTPAAPDSYDAVVVATKDLLTQCAVPAGVELSGSYQEWGGGGTATSIFVPFRLVVKPGQPIMRQPLRSGAVESVDPLRVGFAGTFVAGLREGNPDLMQSALDDLFEERDTTADSAGAGLGLPGRRWQLQEMVHSVRAMSDARRALQALAPPIVLADPVQAAPED